MGDRPWKREERLAAAAFGGRRYPANSGARVDARTPLALIQAKHRKVLSMPALIALATELEALAVQEGLAAVVYTRLRRGRGRASEPLVTMPLRSWLRLAARYEIPVDWQELTKYGYEP